MENHNKKLDTTPNERLAKLGYLSTYSSNENSKDANILPGTRLRNIREIFGISRVEASRRSGIPEITLRKWESNQSKLTLKVAIKCINGYLKLGILTSIDWLLNGIGEKPYMMVQHPFHDSNPYSQELLRHMYDSSASLFVAYIDKKERFQLLNKKYESIFNTKAEEVYGKKLSDMIGKQGYTVCKPYIDEALSGKTVKFDYGWEYKPNKYKHLRIQYVPFINNMNQVMGFFSYIEENSINEPSAETEFDSLLYDILPIMPISKRMKFDCASFTRSIELVYECFKKYNIEFTEFKLYELAKHLYYYSYLYKEADPLPYSYRIIEIALQAGALIKRTK
jgi:PAS domain S-box-containing protein